jgi:adenosine deaminase CECR1
VELIFEKYKKEEIAKGYDLPGFYAPALHFFKAKPLIENSKIFKIIKRMPKGAVLHLHNTASVSSDWFVRNITYWPEINVCYTKKGTALIVVM